jgi:hypothetical protein
MNYSQLSGMTMRHLMRTIVYESGKFVDVEYFFHPNLPTEIGAIKLWFQKGIFFVVAKSDDSLECTDKNIESDLKKEGFKSTHSSHDMPWQPAIGRHIRWIWTLMNQQDYLDGLQFEFADNVSQKSVIIQLIAIASRIDIKTVH